jgi:hypothetical protein
METAARPTSTRSTDVRPISTWRKLTVGSLAATGLAFLLLETVIAPFVSKEPVEPAVIVVLAIDFVLAGILLRARQTWLSLVAAAFLLIGMIGAAPHDLPAVIHPDNAGHFVFSVLIFALPLVGIVAGIQSFRNDH